MVDLDRNFASIVVLVLYGTIAVRIPSVFLLKECNPRFLFQKKTKYIYLDLTKFIKK